MNENNLIPNNKRSPSEVRENAAKGGKKSGEVRRRKRDMKKCMEMLLTLPPGTQDDYDILAAVGVNLATLDDDELSNMLVVNAALLAKAKTGDVPAIREIRNIIGKDNSSAELELKKKELKLKEQTMQKERQADEGVTIIDDIGCAAE